MLWRSIFYGMAYGRVTVKLMPIFDRSTWQEWEVEVAKSMEIPVLEVHLSEDESNAPRQPYICSKSQLEADFLERVLPTVLRCRRSRNG